MSASAGDLTRLILPPPKFDRGTISTRWEECEQTVIDTVPDCQTDAMTFWDAYALPTPRSLLPPGANVLPTPVVLRLVVTASNSNGAEGTRRNRFSRSFARLVWSGVVACPSVQTACWHDHWVQLSEACFADRCRRFMTVPRSALASA